MSIIWSCQKSAHHLYIRSKLGECSRYVAIEFRLNGWEHNTSWKKRHPNKSVYPPKANEKQFLLTSFHVPFSFLSIHFDIIFLLCNRLFRYVATTICEFVAFIRFLLKVNIQLTERFISKESNNGREMNKKGKRPKNLWQHADYMYVLTI